MIQRIEHVHGDGGALRSEAEYFADAEIERAIAALLAENRTPPDATRARVPYLLPS